MAGLREIRTRIKSVTNTKKTTYAMKLVSATKLRKAQEAVELSREYTNALAALVARIIREKQDGALAHPLLEQRTTVKRIALIVVGANRGLCGAYNTNVNRAIDAFYKKHSDKEIDVIALGRKPIEYFKKHEIDCLARYNDLTDDPNSWPLEDIMASMEDAFHAGSIDAVYVLYTRFFSALTMSAEAVQFLPVDAAALIAESEAVSDSSPQGGVLFEPSAEEVFMSIIPRIVSGKLRQACLDSKASEHGSRMTAMDSATKNASDLIDSLTRKFNRLRQSSITSEILDIIGGAEGLK